MRGEVCELEVNETFELVAIRCDGSVTEQDGTERRAIPSMLAKPARDVVGSAYFNMNQVGAGVVYPEISCGRE